VYFRPGGRRLPRRGVPERPGVLMAVPTLAHERITATDAAPSRWLLVLHGIYGAGRNWASVMRRFVRQRPDWGAVLVDLREHGGSRGFPPPHTLRAAAADLDALAATLDEPVRAVLGHSFGGKVALVYARDFGRGLDQVWVVDSTPAAGTPRGSAWEMLAAVRRVPDRFETRAEAVAALEAEGISRPVGQWMSTNLIHGPDGYRWRLDFDVMESMLLDFFDTDLWPVVEAPPARVRIHFVKAEESAVLTEEACARIEEAGRRNGRVRLHRVAGGHWVNADNPQALEQLLVEYL